MAGRRATCPRGVLLQTIAVAWVGCWGPDVAPSPPVPETPPIAEPSPEPPMPRPTPRAGELRPRGGLVVAHDAARPRIAIGAAGAIVAWSRRACPESEVAVGLTWAALEEERPVATVAEPCVPTSVALEWRLRDPVAILCRGETCEARGLGDVSAIDPVIPAAPEPSELPVAVDGQRRLVRRYRTGIDVPITGVHAPVTAMAATIGALGPLVLWVEQLPPAHRVRVARLNTIWTEIAATADLDVGDAVVGDVAIDAREGHIAMALTQREGTDWVVRVAELTPP